MRAGSQRRPAFLASGFAAMLLAMSATASLHTITKAPQLTAPDGSAVDDPQATLALRQASQQLALGDRAKALSALAAAQEAIRRSTPSLRAEALALGGRAQLQLGQFDLAEPLLRDALAQAEDTEREALAAATLNDLGLLQAARQDEPRALASFERGQRLALQAQQPGLELRLLLNAADAQQRSGDGAAAQASILRALRQLQAQPPSAERTLLLTSAASRLLDAPAPLSRDSRTAARAALDAALADGSADPRLRSQVLGQSGRYYEQLGQDSAALRDTRRAIFAAQAAQAPELLYLWQWQAGRIQLHQGHPERALTLYRQALATLQPIRQDLLLDLRASRRSYRDSIGPLFTEFADLLLQRSGQTPDDAQRRSQLAEVRSVIEQLKTVELEDYFRDDCVDQFRSRQGGIDRLPPGTAVLYPVVLPDRLELLLSIGDDIQRVTVRVSAATLTAETLLLRRKLEKRSTHEYLPHAQKLHGWLIAPVQAELEARAIDTLVVAPDGPLLGIPFAALHDGREFVVQRYALATIPGLHLVEAQGSATTRPTALLSGLSASVQGFPALPNVSEEIREVGQRYQSETLSDRRFTVPEVEQAARGATFDVMHIASHGQFDRDPRKSFLLTYDGKMGMDSLERIVKFNRLRDDPVDLLTLSACQTAAGDERAALGLAGVAIKAGARSVVATLWYINDEASSTLIRDFYRELASGKRSKAQAMQAAQQRLLADPRYRHPGYWAPFLVIGNWA
ncbi:MAG TPA: CHAT domain-containing protein [Solimonas sp.]|nr:CHAT domain-containing protein [Solimonas sp.]